MAKDFGFSDKSFHKWLKLRSEFAAAKSAKDWPNVIQGCNLILELDDKAKYIGIFVPLFLKEIAKAHAKLGDRPNAIKNYRLAKEAFEEYRESKALNKPDDRLDEIAKMNKAIAKLSVGS
jgi:hypothetical protein